MMITYTQTSTISCEIEDLFNFHLDTSNIKAITPPDTVVTLLNPEITPHEGAVIRIKTVKFFIPTYWEVQISQLESPQLLVDTALRSPFKFWRHTHAFREVEGGCELKDVIEYELPFGWLGKLVGGFIAKDIAAMFSYRHERSKALLEA